MEAGTRTREAVRKIVERTDLDRFTEHVLDAFWDRPEYRRLPAAARGRARLGPLEHRPRGALAGGGRAPDAVGPGALSRAGARPRHRRHARRRGARELPPRRALRLGRAARRGARRRARGAPRERRPPLRVRGPRVAAVLGHLRVHETTGDRVRRGAARPGAAPAGVLGRGAGRARTTRWPSGSATS